MKPSGIDHPDAYVMKPQREGGGNNIWEGEMKDMLMSLAGNPERSRYILMRRINPPIGRNKILRRGVMSDELDTVTEVGVALLFTSLGPPSHQTLLMCSMFGVQIV